MTDIIETCRVATYTQTEMSFWSNSVISDTKFVILITVAQQLQKFRHNVIPVSVLMKFILAAVLTENQ